MNEFLQAIQGLTLLAESALIAKLITGVAASLAASVYVADVMRRWDREDGR